MIIASLLLLIGLLLIFIEFFLPGGFLAIAGGLFVVASLVLFALKALSLLYFSLFLIATVVLVVVVIRFALRRVRKTKSFFQNDDQTGYVASSYASELVGKKARALSDLKPAGHILVEGQSLQAVSRSGYIMKGTQVLIIGGEGGHLIVKELIEE